VAKIWVIGETTPGSTGFKTSLEILTKARALSGTVEAVALGAGAKAAAEAFGQHGATAVYVGEDDAFSTSVGVVTADTLLALIADHSPDLILAPATYDARDALGRVSATLGATLVNNVTDLKDDSTAVTPIFGGAKLVDIALTGSPKLVLIRPKSFEASPSGGSPTIVEVTPVTSGKGATITAKHEEAAAGVKLEDASVVVSGGRGLQQADNFKLLDELSGLIPNSAVGATRAVVDAGWVPYAMQIGQTGKTVKPKVYLAIGISGATQHIVGMKSSDRIVAVNKDEEAPIFSMSDLGIVGDALKIVPALTEELRKRKG
jgi:electron transfer flavoprotein alpha subunit